MTLYAAGLWDEVEFDSDPRDSAHRHRGYGPFTSFEAAAEKAATLSRDPDEGVVIELETGWVNEHVIVLTEEEVRELLWTHDLREPEAHYGDPDHPLRTIKAKLEGSLP